MKTIAEIRKVLSRLGPGMSPHRKWAAAAMAGALLSAATSVILPYFLQLLVDHVVSGQHQRFYGLFPLVAAVVSLHGMSAYLERTSWIRFNTGTIQSLKNALARHLPRMPMARVEEIGAGDILSRLNHDAAGIAALMKGLADLVIQPLIFAGAFAYMMLISWKLLIAILACVPVSFWLSDRVSRALDQYSQDLARAVAREHSIIEDAARGIAVVKAFNLYHWMSGRFEAASGETMQTASKMDWVRLMRTPVILSLRFAPQLICPLFGGYLMAKGELTAGQLLAANTTLIWFIIYPVESLLGIRAALRSSLPLLDRVFALLDIPAEGGAERPLPAIPAAMPVRFEHVSFAYADGAPVLTDVGFALEKGKMTALAGLSGSGKSTVMKLLCGLYDHYEGKIEMFGEDIRRYGPERIREHIALVSQDSILFPISIADNIALGKQGASMEEIEAAARLANAHEFITMLPQGYHTVISEGGGSLSGGQRQRLALARALLKNAPILLLDEPTASLDARSETLIQESLDRIKRDTALLVIAHRASTVKAADTVLLLESGRIVRQGAYDGLAGMEVQP